MNDELSNSDIPTVLKNNTDTSEKKKKKKKGKFKIN